MATPASDTVAVTFLVTSEAVAAGFPSPAQDYFDGSLDLNDHLIRDRTSTFIVRVSGESMVGAGISDGDELVVDRSITPTHGSVVIAILDGELTVKRLELHPGRVVLRAENPEYPPI
ncbi:LexA family transcriptional regulator, partial [Rathayibacter sp. AY1D9]|uniref:LexA family protein n=1 Tax=Rathayibacter sp. AY1D9 TaxID=2080548 RepID=UPI002157FFAB